MSQHSVTAPSIRSKVAFVHLNMSLNHPVQYTESLLTTLHCERRLDNTCVDFCQSRRPSVASADTMAIAMRTVLITAAVA